MPTNQVPVNASEGTTSFDEILLHSCNVNSPGTLKSFNIWVSLVDAKECDLGSFHVDLSEMVSSGNLKSKFGGKAMTLHYISTIFFLINTTYITTFAN